jgi:hypothetical protein
MSYVSVTLCIASTTSVYCCKRIFRYDLVRKLLDTPSYASAESTVTGVGVYHVVKPQAMY